MVTIEEFFKQHEERAAGAATAPGPASVPGPAELPKGVEQILARIIPMVEKGTGKSMDSIIMGAAAAMGKGQLEDYFKNLIPGMGGSESPPIGKKPSEFAYYLRAGAIWIPLLVLFFGTVVIVLIGEYRLMTGWT